MGRLARPEAQKIVAQLGGRAVARGRILGEPSQTDRFEFVGDVGVVARRGDRRLLDVLVGNGDGTVAGERRPRREYFVEHDGQRVHVAARIGLLPLGLLR